MTVIGTQLAAVWTGRALPGRDLLNEVPQCVDDDPTSLCARVYEVTKKPWLAQSSDWLIAKPATVLGIILVALLVRWLLHRMITRLTSSTSERMPTVLRPLSEKAPAALQAAGLLSERRQQRADTIGSVLKSVVSAIIFIVALMTILSELGLNLGPMIASAGIAGVALGFGAQTLVKDILAGMSMILEDQYGVGDVVDVGEASGAVEAVGLRTTTLRDVHGVVWHVRNGEIIRVGNKTQGWAMVVVDVPLPFGTDVEQAKSVMQSAADSVAEDPEFKPDLLDVPEVLGVEQINLTGMTMRMAVKTSSAAQWRVAREFRARISAALDEAGIASGNVPPPPAPAPGAPGATP